MLDIAINNENLPVVEPRRRLRARRLAPLERRVQLLECALRVFARRGLGEARHAEIAKEAKVSIATTFFYFPTRLDLVHAVLDEVERFYCVMAEQTHQDSLPAPQVMLNHAKTFADSVDSHPDYARVWLDWSTAIRDEVWPRYLRFQERVVQVMERTIRRGQEEGSLSTALDPSDEAHLLFGSAHMIAQMKFTRQSPEKIEQFLHTLARVAIGSPATKHNVSVTVEEKKATPSYAARAVSDRLASRTRGGTGFISQTRPTDERATRK